MSRTGSRIAPDQDNATRLDALDLEAIDGCTPRGSGVGQLETARRQAFDAGQHWTRFDTNSKDDAEICHDNKGHGVLPVGTGLSRTQLVNRSAMSREHDPPRTSVA